MLNFKEHVQEDTGMRLIDLLPKKVKRMIYRHQHQDKYKAALLMMKALTKDPDVIKRGLSKQKIQNIAADHFGLDRREFAKVLDRKTRYERTMTPAYRAKDFISEEYLTEGTEASTLFELALIAFITYGSKKEADFITAVNKDSGYKSWLAAASKDKKWNINQSDHYKFAKKIIQVTGGTKAGSAGQTKPATSAMWTEVTGKSKDTSKADITIGKHQVSVKGTQARLMSGVKEESLATLYAAFSSIGVHDLGLDLEKIIDTFVSRVETEGATMDTRSIRKLDPKDLSSINKKAFKELEQQSAVKVQAEAAFNKAFTNRKFADAFAWEAMSGEVKIANGEGVADSMLVWPYDLRNIAWYPNLNSTHKYVKKVSSQMNFSADVKSNSKKKKGVGKTGYTISQTVSLAFKTAETEFDESAQSCTDQRLILENQLTEGKIDEAKLLDRLKGVWERLRNAITIAWTKLINVLRGLKDQLKTALSGGVGTLLNEFDLEVIPKFKNDINL